MVKPFAIVFFIAVRLLQASLAMIYLPLGLVISLLEKAGDKLAGEDDGL